MYKKFIAVILSLCMMFVMIPKSEARGLGIGTYTPIRYQEYPQEYMFPRGIWQDWDIESADVIFILPDIANTKPEVLYAGLAWDLYALGYNPVIFCPFGYGDSTTTSRPITFENILSDMHYAFNYLAGDRQYYIIADGMYGAYCLPYLELYGDEVLGFAGIDTVTPSQINYNLSEKMDRILEIKEYVEQIRSEYTEPSGWVHWDLMYQAFLEDGKFAFSYGNSTSYVFEPYEIYYMYITVMQTLFNQNIMDEINLIEPLFNGEDPFCPDFPDMKYSVPTLHILSDGKCNDPNLQWLQMHKDTFGDFDQNAIIIVEAEQDPYYNHSYQLASMIIGWFEGLYF